MRPYFILGCAFVSLAVKGANVVWSDYFRISDLGNSTYRMECLAKVGDQYWYSQGIDLIISVATLQPDVSTLTFDRNPNSDIATPQNWIRASPGDVVSEATTRNLDASRYLVHDRLDDGEYVGQGQITLQRNNSSDVHLAFTVQTPSYPYECIYGWVEFNVLWDSNGCGYLVDSATGAYASLGEPMIVGGGAWTGGIPEPSGGMLLLWGVAVLGLRRRRGQNLI